MRYPLDISRYKEDSPHLQSRIRGVVACSPQNWEQAYNKISTTENFARMWRQFDLQYDCTIHDRETVYRLALGCQRLSGDDDLKLEHLAEALQYVMRLSLL